MKIALSGSEAAMFAIVGAIIIGLIVVLLIWGKFGKKGAIAMGVVGLLVLGVFGSAFIRKKLETARWMEARAAAVEKNVALLRAAVKETPSANAGFGEACGKLKFKAGKTPMNVTLVQPTLDSSLHLSKKSQGPGDGPFDVAAGPLLKEDEGLSSLPYGLEGALNPELFVVPSAGKVTTRAGKREWTGVMTAINPDSGERCSGNLVVTVYGPTPSDTELMYGVLNEASWHGF